MPEPKVERYVRLRDFKKTLKEFHFVGEVALHQAEQNKDVSQETIDKLHHIIREVVDL